MNLQGSGPCVTAGKLIKKEVKFSIPGMNRKNPTKHKRAVLESVNTFTGKLIKSALLVEPCCSGVLRQHCRIGAKGGKLCM